MSLIAVGDNMVKRQCCKKCQFERNNTIYELLSKIQLIDKRCGQLKNYIALTWFTGSGTQMRPVNRVCLTIPLKWQPILLLERPGENNSITISNMLDQSDYHLLTDDNENMV